jgi:hypothetical protein
VKQQADTRLGEENHWSFVGDLRIKISTSRQVQPKAAGYQLDVSKSQFSNLK